MAKNYKHLTTQERAVVMTMRDDQCVQFRAFMPRRSIALFRAKLYLTS
jgi:hypothetical protein